MNEIRKLRLNHAVISQEARSTGAKTLSYTNASRELLVLLYKPKVESYASQLISSRSWFFSTIWHNKEQDFLLFPTYTRQTAKRAFEMLKAIVSYILTSLTARYHYIGPVGKPFSETVGSEQNG